MQRSPFHDILENRVPEQPLCAPGAIRSGVSWAPTAGTPLALKCLEADKETGVAPMCARMQTAVKAQPWGPLFRPSAGSVFGRGGAIAWEANPRRGERTTVRQAPVPSRVPRPSARVPYRSGRSIRRLLSQVGLPGL